MLAYKGNTIINVLGLVTGIASALVILYVIRYEHSFDAFHSDANQIYRLVRVTGSDVSDLESSECRTGVSYPVPDALKREASLLKEITSIQYMGEALIEVPDASGAILRRFNAESECAITEPSFFTLFDFKNTDFGWISGNQKTALEKPFSIVLSRSMGEKYFPEGNALGKVLKVNKRLDCTVTGVMEDFPANSDFPFGILISYSSFQEELTRKMDDWVSVDDEHQVFVLPAAGASVQDVEKQIEKVHKAHTHKELYESRHYLLQPLKEIHFDARFGNYKGRTITRTTLLGLSIVALFLLLTASINYINLATAQSVMRSKEIGVRKVMGGSRISLVIQFLTETLVVVSIAGVLALGLAQLLLFYLQSLLNIHLDGYSLKDPALMLYLLAIIFGLTLFAGIYPSLVISSFNPVVSLKNRFATDSVGGFSLRKVLVVAQFTMTQMLVVGTFVVIAQMRFFQNTNMGFNHEAVINVDLPDRDTAKRELMEKQLREQSIVAGVTFSFTLPSGAHRRQMHSGVGRGDGDNVNFEFQSADPHYLELYQIKLLAGRNFVENDTARIVMINKTLAKKMELGSPEEAIGGEVRLDDMNFTVVGVFDDYYSNSLKGTVNNMVMLTKPRFFRVASIKLNVREGNSLQGAIHQIEKIWTTIYPEFIFEYEFLDENINAFYEQEQKYSQIFQLFSFIFILIGCLGLYGLITFVVNRKGKEIAIRKVMGASVAGLLFLFSKEYIKLTVLSFLLTVPVAYYVTNSWLSNFSNHIEVTWWLFAVPGFFVLLMAVLVVSAKSISAANKNPIDFLRCE